MNACMYVICVFMHAYKCLCANTYARIHKRLKHTYMHVDSLIIHTDPSASGKYVYVYTNTHRCKYIYFYVYKQTLLN